MYSYFSSQILVKLTFINRPTKNAVEDVIVPTHLLDGSLCIKCNRRLIIIIEIKKIEVASFWGMVQGRYDRGTLKKTMANKQRTIGTFGTHLSNSLFNPTAKDSTCA